MSSVIERYREAVRFLEDLANIQRATAVGTQRADVHLLQTAALLRRIGNPHRVRGIQYIHVAGTAGKGTVARMIGAALHAAGASVGVYTSPYTTTFLEQFWVGGRYVSPADVVWAIERLRAPLNVCAADPSIGVPSYFAARFAIASLLFRRYGVRWQVVETGVGGRYDHTNVIPSSRVAVITNIGPDHLEIIGPTLRDVAREKVGIVKRGTLTIAAERRPSLRRILERGTRRRGGTFVALSPHLLRGLPVGMENAALVRAVGEALRLNPRAVTQGIATTQLPCRQEIVHIRPTVVLDGAHNLLKVKPLVELLRARRARRTHLILAMAAEKDHRGFLTKLLPLADTVTVTRFIIQARRAMDPLRLASSVRQIRRLPVWVELDPHRALTQALAAARPTDLIVATGSFYLVGLLRARWIPEEDILRSRSSFPRRRSPKHAL